MCSFANRFVFVVGGDVSDQVFRLDLATDRWEKLPSIVDGDRIAKASCCTLGNALYVYYVLQRQEDVRISMLKLPGTTSVDRIGSWKVIAEDCGLDGSRETSQN